MVGVAAEFIGASEGLGDLLLDGRQPGKPGQIIAAILVFAGLGTATDSRLLIAAAPLLNAHDLDRP